MSWRSLILPVMMVAGLAGCGDVRPLYAPSAFSSGPEQPAQSIAIAIAGDRIGQKIRNELVFQLNGGQEPAQPRYRMSIRHTEGQVAVGQEYYQKLPAATVVQIDAGFQLYDARTDRLLFQGTSFATAPYNYSSQRFANYRARLDAQDRLALVVADDIRTKVLTWLATHPQP